MLAGHEEQERELRACEVKLAFASAGLPALGVQREPVDYDQLAVIVGRHSGEAASFPPWRRFRAPPYHGGEGRQITPVFPAR
jgi:hypothetical protein